MIPASSWMGWSLQLEFLCESNYKSCIMKTGKKKEFDRESNEKVPAKKEKIADARVWILDLLSLNCCLFGSQETKATE